LAAAFIFSVLCCTSTPLSRYLQTKSKTYELAGEAIRAQKGVREIDVE
jgi:hypothetical protein